MDWSNELYVRVYVRETDDDLALTWQALALWRAMLCRFDRSGFIATKRGARGLAALVRMPHDVVELALPELLGDGRVQEVVSGPVGAGYFAPNFTEAQEASKSDKLRQKEQRDKRRRENHASSESVTFRDDSITKRAATVTASHAASRGVTLCLAEQSKAEPSESSRARDPGSAAGTAPPEPSPTQNVRPGGAPAPDLGHGWSRLSTELWLAGGDRYRALVAEGIDPSARAAWDGLPDKLIGGVIEFMRDEKRLTVDAARECFIGALDTAEAVARGKNPPTLEFLLPSRFLPVDSFRKSAESSPEQVRRRSSAATRGPGGEQTVRKIKNLSPPPAPAPPPSARRD